VTWPRIPFDAEAYDREVTGSRPCFICQLAGTVESPREVVYRDERNIVFLNRYPTLEGYVLVAPIVHREQVVADFNLEEYLGLQSLVFLVGRVMSAVVPTDRLYVFSLGSQQGNRHVHWHVASLPPGIAFKDQQFAALTGEQSGYLDIPATERDAFAARLRSAMDKLSTL
jgi:diadenosine tetraphosphate (Ap4A) HIT family hydrolase